jgi:hypothetical protein
MSLGDGAQHLLALAGLGQRPRGQRRRRLAVTAERGKVGAMQRDPRGDVHQHAAGLAGRRRERLVGGVRGGTLGRVGQDLDLFHVAVVERHGRPRQQQPWPRPGKLGRDRRKPAPHRRPLAASVDELVEVLLDQPGGPDSVASGQHVPHRLVGQPVRL